MINSEDLVEAVRGDPALAINPALLTSTSIRSSAPPPARSPTWRRVRTQTSPLMAEG